MSQAKVDQYKKEKANRKQTMRKEKMMRNVKRCVAGAIALALVGWFGYSAYDLHSSNQERAVHCGKIIAKDLIGREQARDESDEGRSL